MGTTEVRQKHSGGADSGVLCCLLTPGSSKDIWCHAQPDKLIPGHNEMGSQPCDCRCHINLSQGLCGHGLLTILTLYHFIILRRAYQVQKIIWCSTIYGQ